MENSLFINGILGFCRFMLSLYHHSMIKKGIDGLFGFFSEVFRHSMLYPILYYRAIEDGETPFFIRKIQTFYHWIIDGLHHVYVRGMTHSYLAKISRQWQMKEWFAHSLFYKGGHKLLIGVSFEGFLMSVFVLLIPFVNKQLSLLLAFVIFVCFLLSAVIKHNKCFKVTKTSVFALFYLVMLVINSLLSINPSGSMRDLGIHMGGFLVMFAIINSPLKKKDYQLVFDTMIGAAMLVSIYGVYQYVAGVPMGSGWVDATQNPGLTVRSFGTFENPNTFAEYLIMTIPMVVARGIQLLWERKWLKGFAFAIPGGLLSVALLMTASRAGWLGFAFGTVLFVLLINMKFIIPMVIGGIGMIPLLPESILQRIGPIGSLSDSSNLYRYNLWRSSYEIIQDFMVTGIGTGYLAFRTITPYYMKNMAPYHTHNTYIQAIVEYGLIGFVLFLGWCFLLFKDGAHTAQKATVLLSDYMVQL